jgi:hypothetical protein
MRCAVVFVAVLFGAEAPAVGVKASARLSGKEVSFPEQGLLGGARATLALLESCHSMGEGTAADLKKAQEGDHVRLVFARPVAVTVLEDTMEVSELVFTQPLNTGVFWLRAGDKVVRCSKYEPQKEKDFIAWRNEARAAP